MRILLPSKSQLNLSQGFDFSLLTSQNRRDAFFTMIKEYIKSVESQSNVIIDPFFILLGLLLGEQDQEINTAMLMEIGNGNQKHGIFSKEDLEMYIPQLCTYLVFHQQMENMPIFNLLQTTARFDIQFALLYFSYMKSLQTINQNTEFKVVMKYNKTFKRKIDQHYKFLYLPDQIQIQTPSQQLLIQSYNNRQQLPLSLSPNEKLSHPPVRKLYKAILSTSLTCSQNSASEQPEGIFTSSLAFLSDLISLGNLLTSTPVCQRKNLLQNTLKEINKNLPAQIFLPLRGNLAKGVKIASIVFEQGKVWSTKVRAPFYVCFQVYEEKLEVDNGKFKRIVSTRNLNMNQSQLKKSHLFQQDTIQQERQNIDKQQANQTKKRSPHQTFFTKLQNLTKTAKKFYNQTLHIQPESQTTNQIKFQSEHETEVPTPNSTHPQPQPPQNSQSQSQNSEHPKNHAKNDHSSPNSNPIPISSPSSTSSPQSQSQSSPSLFPPSLQCLYNKISSQSPFSSLPGYNVLHYVIKTHDDLRQEAFAMQLLGQFNRIFQMEALDIKVMPYEVVPLGRDCGIIEYIGDALTVDQLRKRGGSLQFINKDDQNGEKLNNFLKTLVGYSLVTYLLQVKDRHNGNIMVKKDGSIVHIDFGFFFSNAPGKGVQLQKKIPFKLTQQYLQTLQSPSSPIFPTFRKQFFLGYKACIKHQHRLLIPTKLMYSSHGTTMPCFQKGHIAIQQFEERLNPRGVRSDGELSLYCQELVNLSIDNWRARWYDKWQYYVQGIFY